MFDVENTINLVKYYYIEKQSVKKLFILDETGLLFVPYPITQRVSKVRTTAAEKYVKNKLQLSLSVDMEGDFPFPIP